MKNPFLLKGYEGSRYFCNRATETKALISAIENGRNITLTSVRRMGKTGLIRHVFGKLNNVDCVYVDVMSANNQKDFTRLFGSAVISQLETPLAKSLARITGMFTRLKPSVTFDPTTQQPSIELNIQSTKDSEATLNDIFNYLKKRNKRTIIAIDEFQQVALFPEKNTEALLRSYIQHLNQVVFIFSGSQQHILTTMFYHASRPFYQSTQFMFIDKIKEAEYATFITNHFTKQKKKIEHSHVADILGWTKLHTFYVQALSYKLFNETEKNVTDQLLKECMDSILVENEPYFYSYKNLLTAQQWNLLVAIAKEDEVRQLNKKDFLTKHGLSASSVQRSVKALVEREMVLQEKDTYRVYDVFLGRWLAAKF
jgi:uncharacterized protein